MPPAPRLLTRLGQGLLLPLVLAWPSASARLRGEEPNPRLTPIVRAVRDARPSVVNIHGRKMVADSEKRDATLQPVNGMGTGVVIDERGYIVTNYHVVEGVSRIKVTLHDEQTLTARLVNHDPRTDLAVIKVDAPRPMPVIRVGTSSDLMVGESVIAVGNAYGYSHTVTEGIISALHRPVPIPDDHTYADLIQTDASINPGNSGGPLLNVNGEMIGINVAVRVGAQGIGFALPIDEALQIVAQLMSVQQLSGVAHGVTGQTVIGREGSHFIVESVKPGTPGAQAGLRAGDVVREVGGVSVARSLDFERSLIGRASGESVELAIDREGQRQSLQMLMGRGQTSSVSTSRTSDDVSERLWSEIGLQISSSPVTDLPLDSSPYKGGMRVTEVRPGSPADQERVQAGDILVGLHRWQTASIRDVTYILGNSEFRQSQPVRFYILRGKDLHYGFLSLTETSQAAFSR